MRWIFRAGALGLCLFAGSSFNPAAAQLARYDGDKVVRVQVQDEAQLATVLSLTDDVWSHEHGVGPIDVRVTPTQLAALEGTGIAFEIMIEDVQQKIDAESDIIATSGIELGGGGFFDVYHTYAEVNAYMDQLVVLRPDLAQTFVMGITLQGREMRALRITGPGPTPKPGVLFHGGQHAREWITVPTSLYVADQLIRNYDTDAYVRELVDRCEFYILPIMNPDGYEYSWTNDRLWRKNRRANSGGSFGVDLNRNWGWQWGGEGSSSSQSSDTYRGPSAFSEPETQALRDFILGNPNVVAYNDIHCFSQLILWPWGYTDVLPADQAEFARIGAGMEARIESLYQTDYVSGPINTTIYPASGGSADWAYGGAGILAFSYELRDTGDEGFLLPADQILPTCEETLPALLYYADETSMALHIDFPAGLPTLASPQSGASFQVRIRANVDTLAPGSATLFARSGSTGAFTPYALVPLGADLFQANLPASGCGPNIEYYVTATGTAGATVVQPAGAPAQVFTLPIGEIIEQFRDNFETAAAGWTVSNTALTAGAWQRAVPVGTSSGGIPSAPANDNPAGTGTFCWVTQNGSPGGGVGAADVDGGPTTLTSPAFSLAGLSDPQISYARWVAAGDNDVLTVELSENGASWQTLEVVGSTRSWNEVSFRVRDLLPAAAAVRVRFSISDNPNNSVTEGGVDDVVIEDFVCESAGLTGDMNCDGLITVGDIAGFVLALTDVAGYAAAFPGCDINQADINGDGLISVSDIGGFVSLLSGR